MINIINGNLFDTDADIICHQCNCQGVMGTGVAAEVKSRYPHVFADYRKDYEDGKLSLGYVCFSNATDTTVIANMCGQDKYGYDGSKYTNYDKLQMCFDEVVKYAYKYNCQKIAFPYLMSCHRGGGDWNIVYEMIKNTFEDFEVEIWRL